LIDRMRRSLEASDRESVEAWRNLFDLED